MAFINKYMFIHTGSTSFTNCNLHLVTSHKTSLHSVLLATLIELTVTYFVYHYPIIILSKQIFINNIYIS